jgi:hypothetical protein
VEGGGEELARPSVAVAAHLACEMRAPLLCGQLGDAVGVERVEIPARDEVTGCGRLQPSREHQRPHMVE